MTIRSDFADFFEARNTAEPEQDADRQFLPTGADYLYERKGHRSPNVCGDGMEWMTGVIITCWLDSGHAGPHEGPGEHGGTKAWDRRRSGESIEG